MIPRPLFLCMNARPIAIVRKGKGCLYVLVQSKISKGPLIDVFKTGRSDWKFQLECVTCKVMDSSIAAFCWLVLIQQLALL